MRYYRINQSIQLLRLMRFHKPIGILLLFWPTLWALWLASKGLPPLFILSIFAVGTIIMRAAGCVMNDIADRHIDCYVERTRYRPLTSGKLSLFAAWVLLIVLLSIAFGLVCLLNRFTLLLAIAGAAIVLLYPFAKRFTHWPQFILGVAFSWGIPMAYAAIQNHIPPIAGLLFIANLLWTMTYDTEYAMTDRNDDLKIGVKSTAILFGVYDRLIIGILQAVVIGILVGVGFATHLSGVYFAAVVSGGLIFLYQQQLMKGCSPENCFQAFLNNHWFGMMIFVGIFFSL